MPVVIPVYHPYQKKTYNPEQTEAIFEIILVLYCIWLVTSTVAIYYHFKTVSKTKNSFLNDYFFGDFIILGWYNFLMSTLSVLLLLIQFGKLIAKIF